LIEVRSVALQQFTVIEYPGMRAADDLNDISDKGMGIEAYARQAKNTVAEQKTYEIRLRAKRRAGTMIGEMQKAKGGAQAGAGRIGAPAMPSQGVRPLSELATSHDQSSRRQKLAAIPDAGFEATFAKPGAGTDRAWRRACFVGRWYQ
jgi:hypothetical protein